ncbi:MAG: alpha/beta fold hydrolase [Methyloceanibacter sp.]|jgi:acetyl esterase/lipase
MPSFRYGVMGAALLVGLCLVSAQAEAAKHEAKPGDSPGKPGAIIAAAPLQGVGAGTKGFRIKYRSTGLNGEPIVVSGMVFIPAGAAPAGGRDVIAWAHPTTGVVEPCAPSLKADPAKTIWGLENILAAGFVVAATDYPGLGTPGIHPYLIGKSEGRAVLDSIRAARNLPDSGASGRFAVWGHSQGGHAVLYAGELARHYAPELKLVGIAAAAPATYLGELFDDDMSTARGKELTAMALWSWSNLYHHSIAAVVEPDATTAFEKMAHDCIESLPELMVLDLTERPFQHRQFLKLNPTKVDPWKSIMTHNTPGQAPAGAPVLLAQGTADTTVPFDVTKRFGEALCKQGTRVSFIKLPGVSHSFVARDSAPAALAWMTARFQGVQAPSDCE